MDFPFGETVTVRRTTVGTNAYGDPAPATWADLKTYLRCAVWPTASVEDNAGRSSVSTSLEVVLPPGSDVLSTDRLVWRGNTYEVLGEPFIWRSPFSGWAPGVQVTVQRVTG